MLYKINELISYYEKDLARAKRWYSNSSLSEAEHKYLFNRREKQLKLLKELQEEANKDFIENYIDDYMEDADEYENVSDGDAEIYHYEIEDENKTIEHIKNTMKEDKENEFTDKDIEYAIEYFKNNDWSWDN